MIIAENNGDQSGENFAVAFALRNSPAEIPLRKSHREKPDCKNGFGDVIPRHR